MVAAPTTLPFYLSCYRFFFTIFKLRGLNVRVINFPLASPVDRIVDWFIGRDQQKPFLRSHFTDARFCSVLCIFFLFFSITSGINFFYSFSHHRDLVRSQVPNSGQNRKFPALCWRKQDDVNKGRQKKTYSVLSYTSK